MPRVLLDTLKTASLQWFMVSTVYKTIFFSMMSYLYRTGFCVDVVIKSNYCVKINVKQEIRMALFNPMPRFEKLSSGQ